MQKKSKLENYLYYLLCSILLFLAPFNIGYYSYKVIEELKGGKVESIVIDNKIAGVSTTNDNSLSDESFQNINEFIKPNEEFDYVNPTVVSESGLVNKSTSDKKSKRINQIMFLCINEKETLGNWSIIYNDKLIAEVKSNELNITDGLILNCQEKVRINRYDDLKLIVNRVDVNNNNTNTIIDVKNDKDFYLIIEYNDNNTFSYSIKEY